MKTPNSIKEDHQILDAALHELKEHFDTVQIFVTRDTKAVQATLDITKSHGSLLTRFGQIKLWVAMVDEFAMNTEREGKIVS